MANVKIELFSFQIQITAADQNFGDQTAALDL